MTASLLLQGLWRRMLQYGFGGWMLQDAAGLMDAAGCCWMLLYTEGCCRMLQDVAGCWRIMDEWMKCLLRVRGGFHYPLLSFSVKGFICKSPRYCTSMERDAINPFVEDTGFCLGSH